MQSSAGTLPLTAPANDEIEVSVFGPGYGETVLVHLGLGDWLLVDSCLDRGTRVPASIGYLRKLGIDAATAVKLILASHWHDDHVGGLASVVEYCGNAQFCCSNALRTQEFITLTKIAGSRSIDRGIQEFAKIIDILQERAKQQSASVPGIGWARESTRLWQRNIGMPGEIFALSPSNAAISLFLQELAAMLPKNDQNRNRLVAARPNQTAVVLWISVKNISIMLGSDLEEEATASRRGWTVILESTTKPSGTAELFKVPHHGSENGHHSGVWSEMLASEPLALLTPFVNGGVALPTRPDTRRICGLTPNAFCTKPIFAPQQKKRHGALEKTIKEVVRSIRTIPNSPGHIRARKKLSDPPEEWRVELFDGAVKLSESFSNYIE